MPIRNLFPSLFACLLLLSAPEAADATSVGASAGLNGGFGGPGQQMRSFSAPSISARVQAPSGDFTVERAQASANLSQGALRALASSGGDFPSVATASASLSSQFTVTGPAGTFTTMSIGLDVLATYYNLDPTGSAPSFVSGSGLPMRNSVLGDLLVTSANGARAELSINHEVQSFVNQVNGNWGVTSVTTNTFGEQTFLLPDRNGVQHFTASQTNQANASTVFRQRFVVNAQVQAGETYDLGAGLFITATGSVPIYASTLAQNSALLSIDFADAAFGFAAEDGYLFSAPAATVPLPPGAPLMAGGLSTLAWIRRRGGRKAA